ncbi:MULTISPECIES: FAD/NAD(P)-binding protein [Streptomycetaceae]|uniref:FAD-dependent urate hydroxylase HpyO/Asp monooxygenase CreE-like FAD/NAD(P)-binding domain-containing protein n=1 Tax=Streptantibioticus cattleyicolor (strain ATCC 35852 / DSM 46488 / JCM 4925 / NBRC 14057 / NRRL 8057) TaxID=1003195 RepID=F8JQK1_STREN|nr:MULTISPECIES: FAD/NAD(P)-binding protein [Streptomycetaceae]AEW97848.1 hypothetical protein SCATT_54770 [Streptantibioticus cattleyicolor NRRL 8057 = DSM 46488]MYS62262.1 FAD-binding protein [Streptomyces sp. SID5468]CCB78167.1 conserved protein of unknown function [Streptantibioticus cattleyicolor NRRL 8057 = DSM 46488]
MTGAPRQIAIVGAGPRGLSVLERLCANAGHLGAGPVTVHVVDPHAPGAGAVWRTDQSGHLLMNTVASQVTVFSDDSVEMAGPVRPGPSLYEWARFLTLMGPFDDHEPRVLAEARDLGPDDYPTRAFYGRYLTWAFQRVVSTAPAGVTVEVHRSAAVALDDTAPNGPDAPQTLRLADGTELTVDAVVLAQGHTAARRTPRAARLAAFAEEHGLAYLPPANPADLDLSFVAPGEKVLLRGLGLNFFDHMALFTQGRGGVFERVGTTTVYHPSGREPRLYAGSRRGIPYHSRGENEKGPHGRHLPRLLTTDHVATLRKRAEAGDPVDFRAELWPLVAAEVEAVYYAALLRAHGRVSDAEVLTERYLAAPDDAGRRHLLDAYRVPAADRWDWDRVARPHHGRTFTDQADFDRWLLAYLRRDVARARQGNVSGPVKAALDVLRDLRNEIRLAVDHAGLTGDSHRDHLDGWYTPLNAFLSIGPPASRIEEMIALIEAGVLTVLAPGLEVTADPAAGAFTARSAALPGHRVSASVLVEARLPEPDLRTTADPLLRHLLATGQCRTHRVPTPGAAPYETGGLAVTDRPYHLIGADGTSHPRRFAYGVPTESVHWVTAAGIRPGVNSVTLGDSDAIARAVLALTPAGAPLADPRLTEVTA